MKVSNYTQMHVEQDREDLKEEIKYDIMDKVHVLLGSFKEEIQRQLSVELESMVLSKDSNSNPNSNSECFRNNRSKKFFPVTPEALKIAARHLRRQTPNVATYGFISSTMLASARNQRHQQVYQSSLITSQMLKETKEKIMHPYAWPSASNGQLKFPLFLSTRTCTPSSKQKSFLITPEALMNRGRHLRRQTPTIATYEFISPEMVAIATAKNQSSRQSQFPSKEHAQRMVTSKMLNETREKIFTSNQKSHFDLEHRKKSPITREALMNKSRRLQKQKPRVATYKAITPAMIATAQKKRRMLLHTEEAMISDKMLIEAKKKIMASSNR
eukprot:Awhi_evm2s4862